VAWNRVPSSVRSSARIRLASGSVTYAVGEGTQLKTIPTRVTTRGLADSTAAVVIVGMGVKDPAGTSPSTPFCTCTCSTLPSASAARNTARLLPSGDLVRSAVASAAAVRPWVVLASRFVRSPANTPPATPDGAPASGAPDGSMTVMVPSPPLPFGALANQGRPNPLLSEIPRGRLTDGRSAVAAPGLFTPLRKAGLCAAYSRTAPPRALACPPAAAKPSGTATGPARRSRDRMAPCGSSERASGAPKFEVLATNSRVRSRISPGAVRAAKAALSWKGPPRWKVPTCVIAEAPGIPLATTWASAGSGSTGSAAGVGEESAAPAARVERTAMPAPTRTASTPESTRTADCLFITDLLRRAGGGGAVADATHVSCATAGGRAVAWWSSSGLHVSQHHGAHASEIAAAGTKPSP